MSDLWQFGELAELVGGRPPPLANSEGLAHRHLGNVLVELARNPETAHRVAGFAAAVDEPFDVSPQSLCAGHQG